MASGNDTSGVKVVATNRSARHDYTILDTVECGLVLRGSEVKSLRDAQVQIKESHARFENGEAWLVGMHIAPHASTGAHDLPEPDRKRKLLMHREQIERWRMRVDLERLALVPLSIYFKDGRAKVGLGIGRGRKLYDKRASIAKKDEEREAARERRGREKSGY